MHPAEGKFGRVSVGTESMYNRIRIADAAHSRARKLAMKYKIVLEESEEGFAVSALNLPGCHSQGATEEEALENIKDAIREYLAAINDRLRSANVREIEVEV
jgi:predicted RNase H-like HicB family nuclease